MSVHINPYSYYPNYWQAQAAERDRRLEKIDDAALKNFAGPVTCLSTGKTEFRIPPIPIQKEKSKCQKDFLKPSCQIVKKKPKQNKFSSPKMQAIYREFMKNSHGLTKKQCKP